jgi:hypothetical protein
VAGACCGAAGDTCTADGDCCSGEVCTGGHCGACEQAGACNKNDDCCSFNCCAGQCATTQCTNCPANSPTCNNALTVDGTLAETLCGVADADYIAFVQCACQGVCKTACGDNYCADVAATTACDNCIVDTSAAGCGTAYNACTMN